MGPETQVRVPRERPQPDVDAEEELELGRYWDALITRWDIEIVYGWTSGDGSFWTDTEQLKYAIKKAGVAPSAASYRIVLNNKQGRPDVKGWSSTTLLSTDGMVRQSLGSTIEHNGLGGSASYWRRT